MQNNLGRVVDAPRAIARLEFRDGASADDIAGALLETASEMLLREYGSAQVARLLRSLGDAIERGAEVARLGSNAGLADV